MSSAPHQPWQLSDLQPYRTGPASDTYWRMPIFALPRASAPVRELLKAHNYPHNCLVMEFQYLLECISRSLPGYEKCKIAELRQFARQRRLSIEDNSSRKELAAALRYADGNPSFPHFLKLPPEVRVIFYKTYCAPFADEPLTLPTYPPLARVNKQLRDEVLPIFYSSCTFSVNLQADSTTYGQISRVLRMQRETTLFFKSLEPCMLACIQKLDITFETGPSHRFLPRERFNMQIEMPKSGKKARVQICVSKTNGSSTAGPLTHPWGSAPVGPQRLKGFESEVERFAKVVQTRGSNMNHLVIDDVYRLRSMLEKFL